MIKKLLSVPENLGSCFHRLKRADEKEWFCASDPAGCKLGSGGGSAWLLKKCREQEAPEQTPEEWLGEAKRILLHAGGQSRRLPGYAPSGKILTPIPVFRWATGQRLDQDLLSLQLPLYEKILQQAPAGLHTLIASGDVYIRNEEPLQEIPEADVVCYGLWTDPSLASRHGVFFMKREEPEVMDFMLQKPSPQRLSELAGSHLFLMDIGIWLLSDRAVKLLCERSLSSEGRNFRFYDLYSDFGPALGIHPEKEDAALKELTVSVLPLNGGEFYHYGTSRELISSTLAIQNRVYDQRLIVQRYVKPHPSIFVQNAVVELPLDAGNRNLWIENSHIGKHWKIRQDHIFTGIPLNDWSVDVAEGICIDLVPTGDTAYTVRPYGIGDTFKGRLKDESTLFLGRPFGKWLQERKLDFTNTGLKENEDLQEAALFPICGTKEEAEKVLIWMISQPDLQSGKRLWLANRRISANELSSQANLVRLFEQRHAFRNGNWPVLAQNYKQSVFYHLNLAQAAEEFFRNGIKLPGKLPEQAPRMIQIRDRMFRAKVLQLSSEEAKAKVEEAEAFRILREGLIESVRSQKLSPMRAVHTDQIVWSRSPVRIDLAGGWTDTPPYCLHEGGKVVNIAIELNGQPPIQVYVKPCPENRIILRSIDRGASETVTTYQHLQAFDKVGSPFSIPKAALVLTGFSPDFSALPYPTLEQQLKAVGGGLELTLLSAIPAGSGLGTSSILAATVLGALADFYGMSWDKNEICHRTLVLEQMLTTGGGWQDQFGGVLAGAKLLETESGFLQSPVVKWLPDTLFTEPEYKACHLLYYTGITRSAKNILAEIVKGMFLNETEHLYRLKEMKRHAQELFEILQKGDFIQMGQLVRKTWEQNKALDAGTNPQEIENLIRKIKDFTLGYKLPGAGGGGYLYMIAKDPQAAGRIRQTLTQHPLNERARFVEMSLSKKGLEVSRS